MIVDPVQAMASLTEFKTTTTAATPLPTVTPLLPIYQRPVILARGHYGECCEAAEVSAAPTKSRTDLAVRQQALYLNLRWSSIYHCKS